MSTKNSIDSIYFSLLGIGLSFALVAGMYGCASHLASSKPKLIPVTHQSIFLKPLGGLEKLQTQEYWPKDKAEQEMLLATFDQLYKNLLAEFRRCEKYGLYSMVDSTGSSTMIISPSICAVSIRDDTLSMPVEFKTSSKTESYSNSFSVPAFGIIPHDTIAGISLQKLDAAILDYRRRFPYRQVVTIFYE